MPERRETIILDDAALARLQREAGGENLDRLIAAFLRANPGWLAAHPDLYAVLQPPRRLHGEAVADHMAAMLEQARRHGTGAAAGRRAADGFTQRVQESVLALMRAADPVWCLEHDLPGLLRVEGVRLGAEVALAGLDLLPAGTIDELLGQRCALVRDAVPSPLLHGAVSRLVRREALLRVKLAAGPALLVLAARDPEELDGAGTQALCFLGEAVAAALERV